VVDSVSTTDSSCFLSLPNSPARFWSAQILGSSNCFLTISRRAFLPSMSKIPPEISSTGLGVLQPLGDGVDLLGFHGMSPENKELYRDGARRLRAPWGTLFQQITHDIREPDFVRQLIKIPRSDNDIDTDLGK